MRKIVSQQYVQLSTICIAFCNLLFSSIATAQHPLVSHAQFPAALQNSVITAMHIDETGFLWIGTQKGLYKYDGNRLITFSSRQRGLNKIASSDITSIGQDIDGNIVVATYGGGLLHWDDQDQYFQQITKFGPYDMPYIKRLMVASDGDLWISNNKLVIQYDLDSKSAVSWSTSVTDKHVGTDPIILAEDNQGIVYIAQANRLAVVDPKSGKIREHQVSLRAAKTPIKATALQYLNNEGLLLGTSTGEILLLDAMTGKTINQASTSTSSVLVADILFHLDRIFVATDSGMYLLNKNLEFQLSGTMPKIDFSSRNIYSLLPFGEYVMVGTYHGLNILSFSPFELFQIEDGNHRKDFLAFEEESEGRMWIGTYNGLYLYDPEVQAHYRFGSSFDIADRESLSDERVTALASLNGHLWIGFFDGGINLLSLENRSINRVLLDRNIQISVVDLLADEELNSMWIATYNKGLIRITNDEVKEYLSSGDFPEATVTRLYRTSNGRLFASSLQKLFAYSYDTDNFEELDLNFGLEGQQPFINSIKEVKSGDIWLGTREHGIFVWSADDQLSGSLLIQSHKVLTGLQDATIYAIEQGSNGHIWISTERGILETDSQGNFIHLFTIADGLQSNDFSFGSSYVDSKGRVYFGGPNGYNRFQPGRASSVSRPPKTVLTYVSSPKYSYSPQHLEQRDSIIRFSHQDYFITFEFSIMDFVNSGSSEFRYFLEGFDQAWINSGRNYSATYTNLPAGDYRFRVVGMNSSGVWDEQGASVSLTVLPPPWKTGWAYAAYALLIALFVWVLHRVYHSYVVDRRAAAMTLEMFENEERADDEMQEQIEYQDELIKLAFRHKLDTLELVSTFLPQPGVSPREFLDSPDVSSNHKRLRVLSILEQHIFYGPNGPMANLFEFVEALLPELLNISEVPTDRIITVNKIPDVLIPCDIASPLAIIIYELISNSLEHAFDVSSAANYLFVDLELDSQGQTSELVYRLSVTDNGIGCPQNLFELAKPGSGIGIVLAIVDILEGSIKLKDDNGTSIILTLPVGE